MQVPAGLPAGIKLGDASSRKCCMLLRRSAHSTNIREFETGPYPCSITPVNNDARFNNVLAKVMQTPPPHLPGPVLVGQSNTSMTVCLAFFKSRIQMGLSWSGSRREAPLSKTKSAGGWGS